MSTLAPIALFVYNRPGHTRQTVEALQKNELAGESDLIIFSDAPKKTEAEKAVREVREYIRTIGGFNSVTIVERETNFGLERSIIEGVTSIVNERGRVIVLEDDLRVAPNFLDFMNRALDKYENEQRVIQISGYMYPVKLEIEEDALFLPTTSCWGWATWKRAWELFDPDAKGYALLKADRALRERFNFDGAYDYFSMLEDQQAGRTSSWGVRWYLATFLADRLTLFPRYSLVSNEGFDGSGTHGDGRASNFTHSLQLDGAPVEIFPRVINVSCAWQTVCRSIKPKLSLLAMAKKMVRRALMAFRLMGH